MEREEIIAKAWKKCERFYNEPSPTSQAEMLANEALVMVLDEREVATARVSELEDDIELMKSLNRSKLPCGHFSHYGFTDNGGETGFCTLCRIADLEHLLNTPKEKV